MNRFESKSPKINWAGKATRPRVPQRLCDDPPHMLHFLTVGTRGKRIGVFFFQVLASSSQTGNFARIVSGKKSVSSHLAMDKVHVAARRLDPLDFFLWTVAYKTNTAGKVDGE